MLCCMLCCMLCTLKLCCSNNKSFLFSVHSVSEEMLGLMLGVVLGVVLTVVLGVGCCTGFPNM